MFEIKATPKWTMTQEAFDLLLARLAADREQAGQVYENLRLKLGYFFEGRNSLMPEALIDATINRLAIKIQSGEEVQNIPAYALKIAHFVWLESNKKDHTVSLEELPLANDWSLANKIERERSAQEMDEARYKEMERLVLNLSESSRELLREYYQSPTEQRQQMAKRLGISENALYLKIFRIRQKLEAGPDSS